MTLTPRAIKALLFAAERRHKRRLGELLSITALGSRGKEQALKRQLEQLFKD